MTGPVIQQVNHLPKIAGSINLQTLYDCSLRGILDRQDYSLISFRPGFDGH